MATQVPFSQQQAFAAKYWYERLQYTWGPRDVSAGATVPAFSVQRINKTEIPEWSATLSGVAATQNSNLALGFSFDNRSIPALAGQGQTNALPAGVREEDFLWLPAVRSLALHVQNQNLGAALNNIQLNYQVVLRRLTVADKLLLGIEQFTQDEQDALNEKSLDVRALVEKGTHPIPSAAQIERTYANRLLFSTVRLLHVDADTADTSFLTVRSSEAGPGTFLVLRELAVEGGANVVVSVDRDDDYNYMGVNGAAFVEADDRPWDVFVPALNFLTFHIQAPAPVADVPVRIVIWHLRLSEILRVRFGLVRRGELPDNTYLRAIAGVV